MVDFSPLFEALKSNPFPAFLTLALLAIGWLVKALKASYDAHLQTALQVAPLASKLVDCVEVLERLSMRQGGA